jgi:hypothetical protein
MLKAIRRLFKRLLVAALAAFCIFAAAMVYFAFACKQGPASPLAASPSPPERQKLTADVKDYARPEQDTYATYPEWYIVWSYQEKADYQEKHLPSGFPYFAAIRQYWSGYCCTYGMTRSVYPFNVGDHVMLAVIGTSFSGEYLLKAAYEKTIGRLTEWLSSGEPAEEDQYAYRTARAYADFVHIRPFYEFSFWKRLQGLWHETKLWGPHPVRKWERKAFLSIDYAAEAFYCWLIEKLTHATYGVEGADTYAWVENAPEHPRVRRIKQVGPQAYIVAMPRYQEFTTVASQIAGQGAHFIEIAGNGRIALTVISGREWTLPPTDCSTLFAADIPTNPDRRRIALSCPVTSLHRVLNDRSRDVQIEHIYDY